MPPFDIENRYDSEIDMEKAEMRSYTINFPNAQARKSVILKTVENANNEGDKNVYFIDGGSVKEIIGGGDSISVDACHPNDLGFMSMAKLIGNKLSEIL